MVDLKFLFGYNACDYTIYTIAIICTFGLNLCCHDVHKYGKIK